MSMRFPLSFRYIEYKIARRTGAIYIGLLKPCSVSQDCYAIFLTDIKLQEL